jgi:hypothetical protein
MSAQRNISLSDLARKIKMHRNTLHQKMKHYGIRKCFDDLSDAELKSPILGFGISLDFCVVMGFMFRGTGYNEL